MAAKVPTAMRLYQDTLDRLDKLVANPPAWLTSMTFGPVQDRTDVVERLIFLAERHSGFGLPADDDQHDKIANGSPTGRGHKAKKGK